MHTYSNKLSIGTTITMNSQLANQTASNKERFTDVQFQDQV